MGSGDANSPTAEFDRLFQIMRNAQVSTDVRFTLFYILHQNCMLARCVYLQLYPYLYVFEQEGRDITPTLLRRSTC